MNTWVVRMYIPIICVSVFENPYEYGGIHVLFKVGGGGKVYCSPGRYLP